MTNRRGFFEQVYAIVRDIPAGRVATYGQIARLLGQPRAARTVGWALGATRVPDDVPWHRVINGNGRISLRDGRGAELQRALLEDEGVAFDLSGRTDVSRFGYVCAIDRPRS